MREKPDFENKHVKRIVALEKENESLKVKLRDLLSRQQGIAPEAQPFVATAPQPQMVQPNIAAMLGSSDVLGQTLLNALLAAQSNQKRER